MEEIISWVQKIRAECNIIPTPGLSGIGSLTLWVRFHSCSMLPEVGILLWEQLLFTSEGTGAWGELEKPEVLNQAIRYIQTEEQFARYGII